MLRAAAYIAVERDSPFADRSATAEKPKLVNALAAVMNAQI